jgi:hypothetical protein
VGVFGSLPFSKFSIFFRGDVNDTAYEATILTQAYMLEAVATEWRQKKQSLWILLFECPEFYAELLLQGEGLLICLHNPVVVVQVDTLRPRLELATFATMRRQLVKVLVDRNGFRIAIEDC